MGGYRGNRRLGALRAGKTGVPVLKLYTTPLSANGRKVLAVSRQLELKPDIHLVNVYRGEGRSPEYLAINPLGKIPTLVDGNLTLYESNAILQYLSEVHGAYRLWSRDPGVRALIARWLYWECGHWQPVLTTLLSACVGHRLLPERVPLPAANVNWEDAELRPLLAVLHRTLSETAFLAGDDVTLADFAVAGMVTYFSVANFPFEKHPAFSDWYGRVEASDGWVASRDPMWVM
jgi:glutathione S-transferase